MSAPNAWQISMAMAAWNNARYRAEDDPEMLEALGDATEDVRELLARVLRAVVDADDMMEAAKERARIINARAARYASQKDQLRGLAMAIMETLGDPKVKLPDLTASIGPGKPRVNITDEALIPDEYVRIKHEPNRAEILAGMVLGELVPGAELLPPVPTLTVRTK